MAIDPRMFDMYDVYDTPMVNPTRFNVPNKAPKMSGSAPDFNWTAQGKVGGTNKYKDKWIKMANTPVKVDGYVHEVSLTVNTETVDMYSSEQSWKDAIKLKLADKLAELLVAQMTFTQMQDPINRQTTIIGRVFAMKESDLSNIVDSNITRAAP